MLRLMPILEHMGACEESKFWLRKRNYATFAEAWDACDDAWWKDWVVAALADDGCVGACILCGTVRPWNGDLFLAACRDERHNVEHWLVGYAYKHGCAVEVSS